MLLEAVEPGAVVPEDLALARVAHALEPEEGLDRAGIGRVVVRPVGRDDDVVVAHGRDGVAHHVLIGSTDTQQLRRKYSLGRMVRRNRSSSPNFSTRSSRLQSHHGTQPQLPSRNAALSPEKRSKTPPVKRLPRAIICSTGCATACAIA